MVWLLVLKVTNWNYEYLPHGQTGIKLALAVR